MAKDISFATFNLHNFQQAGLAVHRGRIVTEDEYTGKKLWIQNMLKKVNADVIAFQELWHKSCLEEVFSATGLEGYRLVYIADSWYNIAVAVAVRQPWVVEGDAEVIKQFPFTELVKLDSGDGEDDEVGVTISKFSRSILKVTLKHSDSATTPKITLFACHLKSKMLSDSGGIDSRYRSAVGGAISTIRRTAEATALRMLLTDHMHGAGTPTVVIGDLNDDPLSNTVNIISEQPSISTRSRGGDKSLYNTLHFQQLNSYKDVYYTHEFNNHKGVIDHILVSEEFFEYSSDSEWKHEGTRVWNDYIEDDDPFTSDHGIVKSSFS